jgi:D-amino-acid dehydrogenase
MRELGVEREVKTAAECVALEPALAYSEDRVVGGAYAPQDESGDAYRFTRQLAAHAAKKGVAFRYGVAIEALEPAGEFIAAVRARDGERFAADAYVVSLGSYSPLLLRPLGIRIPVYPLKGYSITLPLGPAEAPAAPSVSLTDEAFKLVISRLGERLRVAGTAELAGYDTSVNEVRCAAILRRVRQLFPQLGAVNVVENWAGLRPATPSNVPLVGRSPLRNLYLNTGHGTLGWTLACGSGRALADIVSGRRPEVRFDYLA